MIFWHVIFLGGVPPFILKIKAQKHLCKHWFMIPGWSKQPPISWLNSLSTLPICTSVSSCVHTLNIFSQSWLGIFHFTLPSIPDLLVISIFVSFQAFWSWQKIEYGFQDWSHEDKKSCSQNNICIRDLSNTKPPCHPLIQPGSIWLVGPKLLKRCSLESKGGLVQERFL